MALTSSLRCSPNPAAAELAAGVVQKGCFSKAADPLVRGAYARVCEHNKGARTQLTTFFNHSFRSNSPHRFSGFASASRPSRRRDTKNSVVNSNFVFPNTDKILGCDLTSMGRTEYAGRLGRD